VDGIHDLGGMHGFGAVVRDEAVFHAPWHRRVFLMSTLAEVDGNIDYFRHSIERLDPGTYLTAGYYGRWLAALEVRLVEHGLITSDEIDQRSGAGAAARPSAAPPGSLPQSRLDSPNEGSQVRAVDRSPRFAVGDAVLVADVHPVGHIRLPRFVRAKHGRVHLVHPACVFPDTNAHGRGEAPQYVYSVAFAALDLWGEGDHTVLVDIFEPHLEAV
jgi:nitrile hydratase